jgi:hypothetical protein
VIDRAAEVTSCTRALLADRRYIGAATIGEAWSDRKSADRVRSWFHRRVAELARIRRGLVIDDDATRTKIVKRLDDRIVADAQQARDRIRAERNRLRLYSDDLPKQVDRHAVLTGTKAKAVFETALVLLTEFDRELARGRVDFDFPSSSTAGAPALERI